MPIYRLSTLSLSVCYKAIRITCELLVDRKVLWKYNVEQRVNVNQTSLFNFFNHLLASSNFASRAALPGSWLGVVGPWPGLDSKDDAPLMLQELVGDAFIAMATGSVVATWRRLPLALQFTSLVMMLSLSSWSLLVLSSSIDSGIWHWSVGEVPGLNDSLKNTNSKQNIRTLIHVM